jgi:Na+/melibiose symporter-like transporter
LGGISFGLIEGPVMGWGSAPVVGSLVAGVVGLALFVLVEARVAAPMMPLALFSVQNFYGSNLTTLAVYGALEAMLFFLVLYVQSIMGYSALASGLLFVPISLFLLLLSPFFGRMSGRHGPRLFMTLGPIVAGLGILLLLRLEPDSGFWLGPVPGIVIFSLGLTVLVAPLTTTVMSSIRSEHSGVAAGINEVVARIAGLITIASLGVVLTLGFNAGLRARLNDPAAAPQAAPLAGETVDPNAAVAELDALPAETRDAVLASYTAAFRWVMLSNAILTIAGGVIAWLVIRNPPPEPVQG